MSSKRLAVLVGVLVILMLSVSAIYAQGPGDGDGRGPGGKGGPRGGHRVLIEEIANATDTSVEDIMSARASGQSFNDYVTENGGDPAAVVSAVLANAEEKMNEAVANGDMTQEEADEKLAELETRLTEAMASTDPLQRPEGRPGKGGRRGFGAIGTISEAIGLDAEEIMSTWQEGGTLADIITANGGDVEAVKAQIVADVTEKINEALAEGKIDQAEADEKLAELEAHVDEQLNSEFEAREGKPGPRGPRQDNGDAPAAPEATE